MIAKWYDKKYKVKLKKESKKNLEAVGVYVEAEAKRNIVEMKAVKTGKLLGSIFHEMKDKETVLIGSTVKHAVYVEMGTVKMSPRPFLRNAIQKNIPKIKRILKK